MNPIRLLKLARRANKIVNLFTEATTAHERNPMGKSPFKSKTFWVNIVSGVLEFSGLLTGVVPPGALMYTTVAANLALRLLTNQPIVFK